MLSTFVVVNVCCCCLCYTLIFVYVCCLPSSLFMFVVSGTKPSSQRTRTTQRKQMKKTSDVYKL